MQLGQTLQKLYRLSPEILLLRALLFTNWQLVVLGRADEGLVALVRASAASGSVGPVSPPPLALDALYDTTTFSASSVS
jgi:hypothetical protein